jgi:putative hydrolase of the HAD superfamily
MPDTPDNRPARPPAVEAAIFDLGGVVLEIRLDAAVQAWSRRTGLDAEDIRRALIDDRRYELLEQGRIPFEDYRRHLCSRMGCELGEAEFLEGFNAILHDEIPGMRRLIERLRRQVRLAVLSNTNIAHAENYRRRFARTLEPFERIFESQALGARKPDERAYRAVLEYLQLPPQRCVFLDDRRENVEAAARMGLRTVEVAGPQDVLRGLRELGLEV